MKKIVALGLIIMLMGTAFVGIENVESYQICSEEDFPITIGKA